MAKIRKGECVNCGQCCRYLGLSMNVPDSDLLEFLAAHFEEVRVHREKQDLYFILYRHECAKLKYREDGTTYCILHEEDRHPNICKKYPVEHAMLFEGCGFTFEEESGIIDEGS